MKTLKATVLSAMLLVGSMSFAQQEIGGVTLPASFQAGNAKVILNGGGLREKMWIDLYVGGLYLKAKTSNSQTIIDANEEMAIKLQIVSGLITSEKMIEATKEGFEKSTGGNMSSMQGQIDKFIEAFKEPIVEGDVYDIIYVPSQGVEVYKAGKLKQRIPGLAFKKALFGIWLGADPADEDLKEGMLGLD